VRRAVVGIALLSYSVAAHLSYHIGAQQLAVLCLFAVFLIITFLYVFSGPRPSRPSVAALVVICAITLAGLLFQTSLPVVLFPLAINVALFIVFGRTLINGREALITRFARLERDDLPDVVVRYTSRLTAVWCGVFALLALEVVLLAVLASPEVWSLFVNLLNYIFVGTLFVLEYVYRRWRFPGQSAQSPWQFFVGLSRADWVKLSQN